ncbi:MAG: ABC transporter ATP-binding protein [Chloroflexi bacterium]|nr:ABC transporter ATP-binding protein [Chloroflexota bacterium]
MAVCIAKPLVRLIEVTRTYQIGARTFHALRNVSLDIEEREFVAIVGPSGSGKSTLLNVLTGIDKPTSGQVWVGGVQVDALDENALARWRGENVGIVFQFFQLLPTLTVLENVALPRELRHLWRRADHSRAREILELVGMGDHADKLPSELSGGERQRAALARALMNDPPILVADEPTGNLDSATGEQIVRLLREQHREGKTIILVTHEAPLAEVATRQIRMLDGRIDGSSREDARK